MAGGRFSITNFSSKGLINPEDIGYSDSVDIITEEFSKMQRSYIKIGFYLKHIKEKELYLEGGYSNIWECAADLFGLKQSAASRYISTCERFSVDGNSPILDDKYSAFNKSQLIEMVAIEEDKLNEITPDMTVKSIRDKKKTEKAKDDDEDISVPGQMDIEDYPDALPDEDMEDGYKTAEQDNAIEHTDGEVSKPVKIDGNNKSADKKTSVDFSYKGILECFEGVALEAPKYGKFVLFEDVKRILHLFCADPDIP